LTRRDNQRVKQRSTDNVDAYDLFLRGRTKFYTMTLDGHEAAGRLFQQAIERDKNFVPPLTYLSFMQCSHWLFMWPGQQGNLADALAYAEKAVAIDAGSGMARTRLGWTQLWMRQHEIAIENLRRGVALDPTNGEGYAYLAEALNYAGRPERAVEMTQKALENDPMLPPNCQFHLGHSYYLLGKFAAAAETISGAMKLMRNFPPGHLVLSAVYCELGQMSAAANEIEILRDLTPNYSIKQIDRLYPHQLAAVKQRFLDTLGTAGMRQD
jgi:tetratricopeptide (TPR) repeat protein